MPLFQINELWLPVGLVIDYTLILEQVVDFVLFCVGFTLGVKLRGKGDDLPQNNSLHLRIFSTFQGIMLWDLVELVVLPYRSKISLKVEISKMSKSRYSISEKKRINLSFSPMPG